MVLSATKFISSYIAILLIMVKVEITFFHLVSDGKSIIYNRIECYPMI